MLSYKSWRCTLSSKTLAFLTVCRLLACVHTARSVQRRILSVGDLHGDFDQAFKILRSLEVIDEHGAWSGGADVVIQTGDIADRGTREVDVYKLLFRLQDEAPAYGGEVMLLLGNHELMNLQGDFRDARGGIANRTTAFAPEGWLSKELLRRSQVIAHVGQDYGIQPPVVYVHAGILPAVAETLVDRPHNLSTECAGQKAAEALNSAVRHLLSNRTWAELRDDGSAYLARTGPLWDRYLASSPDAGVCVDLEKSLKIFGAARMVVGHTAQRDGKVHHRCRGHLVLADTLISSAYEGGGHPSAVEVGTAGEAFAIYPEGDSGHVREALPIVEPLSEETFLGGVGSGIASELRWHLWILGLDLKVQMQSILNAASAQAALREVRQAYRRLSMSRHPDRGGTQEEFSELQAAFHGAVHQLPAFATIVLSR